MGDGHCYRVPLIRFHPRVDFILISELKDLVKFCLGRTVPDASVLMFLKNAELFPSLTVSVQCVVKLFIT